METPKAKNETSKESQFLDPDDDGLEEADEEEIQAALSRPPPVNSDYLPLPWKGRIGYVSAHDAFVFELLLIRIGLPLHLSALLKSSCFHFSNLPHSINPRKPSSAPRS